MYDDASFFNDFVTKLADEGMDVVILAYSYGACTASQSLKDLTKDERAAAGKTGGVFRIAYLTAVVPAVGADTVATASASSAGGPPQVNIDEFGWMTDFDPEQTGKVVFDSLSSEERIEGSESFGRHAGPAFADPLTHPGYRDVGLPLRESCSVIIDAKWAVSLLSAGTSVKRT
ncbi:hypothetical protein K461DRAFT_278005 [Myriangium duriaei CBS 260.36]|uniref:PE-PPE domain-containing protein n=1 Tax=Myriangium duriaei CBS 260.36 TaxID=1168546 RepID=A0A9P4MKJ0_9PEZI|nr:hypothetical protein K461DRAFT_278005 [Myriangium duriaei CBS 260.36]